MMIIITVTIKLIIRKIILTCFYELVENDSVIVTGKNNSCISPT